MQLVLLDVAAVETEMFQTLKQQIVSFRNVLTHFLAKSNSILPRI